MLTSTNVDVCFTRVFVLIDIAKLLIAFKQMSVHFCCFFFQALIRAIYKAK